MPAKLPKPSPPPSSSLSAQSLDQPALWPALILVSIGIAAYLTSFSGILILDDATAITTNESIRHWSTALHPPHDTTAGGRPILNLSLVFNYMLSGTAVWSYHLVNLAIHLACGLVLFGLIRRTLTGLGFSHALLVAFSTALLWLVHPLNTESVTYLVQRAESLMGLLYLLTLYAFVRGVQSGGARARGWFALALATCLLGMGTKEVMVSAPLIVLLYDRTFLAGSFAAAWRSRWKIYAGLCATWIILPFLVLGTRDGSAGFGSRVSPLEYALTQGPAIAHYLRLCVWPHPLTFDYGDVLTLDWPTVLPGAVLVLGLLAATVWALFKRPALGFLGACFFAILAPSSSFVPISSQTMAEHRMYLPLIPVVLIGALGLCRLPRRIALAALLLLAGLFASLTFQRNKIYGNEEALWRDTLVSRPENARAFNNLAVELVRLGRQSEAIPYYEQALRLNPHYVDAHDNFGLALSAQGRIPEAIAHYQAALRIDPDFTDAHYNLGIAFQTMPRHWPDAITEFEAALRLRPDYFEARNNLGNTLNAVGRTTEAIAQFELLLRQKPDEAPIHFNLALALLATGQDARGIDHLRQALRLHPPEELARLIRASFPPGIRP